MLENYDNPEMKGKYLKIKLGNSTAYEPLIGDFFMRVPVGVPYIVEVIELPKIEFEKLRERRAK